MNTDAQAVNTVYLKKILALVFGPLESKIYLNDIIKNNRVKINEIDF